MSGLIPGKTGAGRERNRCATIRMICLHRSCASILHRLKRFKWKDGSQKSKCHMWSHRTGYQFLSLFRGAAKLSIQFSLCQFSSLNLEFCEALCSSPNVRTIEFWISFKFFHVFHGGLCLSYPFCRSVLWKFHSRRSLM